MTGSRGTAVLRRADKELDGGGEPFGSPEIDRIIWLTNPTAISVIRRRFKGSLSQMIELDWIGDRPTVKPIELTAKPVEPTVKPIKPTDLIRFLKQCFHAI